MNTSPDEPILSVAWLVAPGGDRWLIQGTCALGRSTTNQVVLPDNKVSRRHALIHAQGMHEFWLVDLGSSNGTYANGRRVSQPTRLQDGDQITIGDFRLFFRQPQSEDAARDPTVTEVTFCEVQTVKCWLLLADIIDSTQLAKRLSSEALSVVVGRWLAGGKELIERHGGSINKYLGDGFLAYWKQRENVEPAIGQALKDFQQVQAQANPAFRVVVHCGEVAVGGTATMGEESLMGMEVNRVFRMEKLAGALGQSCLMSEPAHAGLKALLTTIAVGRHELAGFSQPEQFFITEWSQPSCPE